MTACTSASVLASADVLAWLREIGGQASSGESGIVRRRLFRLGSGSDHARCLFRLPGDNLLFGPVQPVQQPAWGGKRVPYRTVAGQPASNRPWPSPSERGGAGDVYPAVVAGQFWKTKEPAHRYRVTFADRKGEGSEMCGKFDGRKVAFLHEYPQF